MLVNLRGRTLLYFPLILYYVGYVRANFEYYDTLHDDDDLAAEFDYDLQARRRRDTGVFAESEDGVTNVGNSTSCNKNNRSKNCTINEDYEETEHHDYYTSHYYKRGTQFFRDLSGNPLNFNKNLKIEKHDRLSTSYNKAFRIPINFHFPFYGNFVDKIVVTTGGFINIGPQFHSFVHRVHYIAPLMADFNPSLKNESVLYIGKSNSVVIVQWDNFVLNGKSNSSNNKTFTFQVSLHKNGTIVMAYKSVPIPLTDIVKTPGNVDVTVGFSDGFIITYRRHDKSKLIVHNLIYSYHKVHLPLFNIDNHAAYVLTLLPNCIQFKTCRGCLSESKITTNFTCRWCPQLGQCSDRLDWHRQRWMQVCSKTAYIDESKCSRGSDHGDDQTSASKKLKKKEKEDSDTDVTVGVVIGTLLFAVLVIAGAVFVYAYTHPLSRPGLLLMENRRPWKRVQNFNELDDCDQLTTS